MFYYWMEDKGQSYSLRSFRVWRICQSLNSAGIGFIPAYYTYILHVDAGISVSTLQTSDYQA